MQSKFLCNTELQTNEDRAMCCAHWKLHLNSHKLILQQGENIPTLPSTAYSSLSKELWRTGIITLRTITLSTREKGKYQYQFKWNYYQEVIITWDCDFQYHHNWTNYLCLSRLIRQTASSYMACFFSPQTEQGIHSVQNLFVNWMHATAQYLDLLNYASLSLYSSYQHTLNPNKMQHSVTEYTKNLAHSTVT